MKKLFTVLAVLLVATALFAQVGLTVKAGGTFGFANYKSVAEGKNEKGETVKFEDIHLEDKALVLKTKGFGFDVGVQYDITDKLLAYVDFNMLFPGDATLNFQDPYLAMALAFDVFPEDVAKKYVNDKGESKAYSVKGMIADMEEYFGVKDESNISTKFSFFSVSAGAAYKFNFDAVKLAVGGGVTLNKASAKSVVVNKKNANIRRESALSFTTVGLNAMVDAKYMVADNIGVGLTLMPQIGLYNKVESSYYTVNGDVSGQKSTTASGFAVSFAMPITVGVSYTF